MESTSVRWQQLIHRYSVPVLMALVLTLQAYIYHETFAAYKRTANDSWRLRLLKDESTLSQPASSPLDAGQIPYEQYYSTLENAVSVARAIVTTYFQLPSTAADFYQHRLMFNSSTSVPVKLSIANPIKSSFDLSLIDMGPLSPGFNTRASLFEPADSFQLSFSIRHFSLQPMRECYDWAIQVDFERQSARTRYRATLNSDFQQCAEQRVAFGDIAGLFTTQILLIALAMVSILIRSQSSMLRSDMIKFRNLICCRADELPHLNINEGIDEEVDELVWQQENHSGIAVWHWFSILVDLWTAFSCVAEVCGFDLSSVITSGMLMGVATALCWVRLLELSVAVGRPYDLYFNIVSRALPAVLMILISVFPIFLGFTMFGLLAFGLAPEYATLDDALVHLFSAMHGDFVLASFTLTQSGIWINRIYFVCFLFFFIYICYNIILVLVREVFGRFLEDFNVSAHQAACAPEVSSPELAANSESTKPVPSGKRPLRDRVVDRVVSVFDQHFRQRSRKELYGPLFQRMAHSLRRGLTVNHAHISIGTCHLQSPPANDCQAPKCILCLIEMILKESTQRIRDIVPKAVDASLVR